MVQDNRESNQPKRTPQFVTSSSKGGEESKTVGKENETDEVARAKEAAEVQEYKTKEVKAKQEALFCEKQIQNVKDLEDKLVKTEELMSKLGKDQYTWENQKKAEESEIAKIKSEWEKKNLELKNKDNNIHDRELSVIAREKTVTEREQLLNKVEKKNLEEEEKYNSLSERLKRDFKNIANVIGKNANIMIENGYDVQGNALWDEIDRLKKWQVEDEQSGKPLHSEQIFRLLCEEVKDCNSIAVEMAHNTNAYGDRYNDIIDNLDKVYKIMPMLKPDYLPKSDDELQIMSNGNKKVKV